MEKLPYCHPRNNPSFSSSLLDSIYRSIDEPDPTSPESTLSKTQNILRLKTPKKFTPKPPPPANPRTKTPSSIRSKIRDLRAPPSPATRLATFLNTIFTKFAGGKQRSAEGRNFGEVPAEKRDRRLLVEELLRGFDLEEEEESDCESVSSSELFELENLSAVGGFGDGLPVYETTDLAVNRAVNHGFIV